MYSKNVDYETKKRAERAIETLERVKHLPNEGVSGFDWPEFLTDKERIKHNNEATKGMTIVDAMCSQFGKKVTGIDGRSARRLNKLEDCKELKVGDVVSLRILDISKKGVVFDNSVYKEEISCNTNLWQYDKLKHFTPKDPIRCKVVSKVSNKVVVDPFVVMFEEWLNSRLEDGKRGKVPARSQYNVKKDKSIVVKNLHLLKGGYTGTVRIDSISDFVGQDVCADAFIPGSQIVLNVESDFSRWEGKNVNAFVFNYMKRPGSANDMSIVCSAKEVLKFKGQQEMINIFSDYTEDNKNWQKLQNAKYEGVVTGVLRSAKKCGVFVEVKDLNVTGMIEVPNSELVNFHPYDKVTVSWDHFDEPMRFNKEVEQFQHTDPYIIEDNILKEFNIKPIFKIAE